ncbi:MAG: hypothetical protein KBD48_03195 [Candidatus Pacebacteria bacterium]|nr:hypothetical protein [Candidatus Paceibacterota bacterium]
MDKTELQKQIAEYFSKLPPEAAAIFSSMAWIDQTEKIGNRYNLTEDQLKSLITETSLALLGVIHLNQYEDILIQELTLPKEKISPMISELDREVFASIRPALENTFESNIENIAKNKYGGAQNIDDRFKGLPPAVQEAITNSNYKKNLYNIASKYKLNMPSMSTLDEVTTKVMLGIIPSENYRNELSVGVQASPENIDLIVSEVNEQVFKNIRSFLIQNTKRDDAENEKIEIPIPPYKKSNIPTPPYKKTEPFVPSNLPIAEFEKKETSDGMKISGIEILADENTEEKADEEKVTIKEDNIMVKSGVSVVEEGSSPQESHIIPSKETQKSVLYGIENPQSTKSILNMKLQGATASGVSKSNQPISNIPTQNTTKSVIHDPYHEQI